MKVPLKTNYKECKYLLKRSFDPVQEYPATCDILTSFTFLEYRTPPTLRSILREQLHLFLSNHSPIWSRLRQVTMCGQNRFLLHDRQARLHHNKHRKQKRPIMSFHLQAWGSPLILVHPLHHVPTLTLHFSTNRNRLQLSSFPILLFSPVL